MIMNENIDLTKILKNCPKGTEFYSSVHGKLKYLSMYVSSSASEISFEDVNSRSIIDGTPTVINFYRNGRLYFTKGECIIFPSKDQRDWSKFNAPWIKNEKFDPKTLKPFDKVLVKCTSIYNSNLVWRIGLFSHFYVEDNSIKIYVLGSDDNSPKSCVIPYNDDTKHLVNTEIETSEYYKYWED